MDGIEDYEIRPADEGWFSHDTGRGWQFRQSNILDPISPELTPYIFEDGGIPLPHMRPQVRRWLKETIYDELEKYHPKPEDWASLILTGSLTTFQYGEASDCDISVFVNPNFMPEWDRATLIGIAVHNLDGKTVMGTPYPLQVFIVSPKITKELLYQPGLRSGYDLDTDQWLVPPEPARSHDVEKEYNAWYVYALETVDKLRSLIKYNPTRATEYWKYLHRRRREEENSGKGDYSIFNIIFKLIVNKGLVGDLDKLTGEHTASNLLAPAQDVYNQQTLSAKLPDGGFCHRHIRHGVYKLEQPYDWEKDSSFREAALPQHRLQWQPGTEGKGFVLTDGSVWTWPTVDMRPQHWQMNGKVKAMGQRNIPGSSFHITPEGNVWQYGEGRSLARDTRAMIRNADPNLNLDTDMLPPAPVQADPFGHAENLMWNVQPQTFASVYDWEEL